MADVSFERRRRRISLTRYCLCMYLLHVWLRDDLYCNESVSLFTQQFIFFFGVGGNTIDPVAMNLGCYMYFALFMTCHGMLDCPDGCGLSMFNPCHT